MKVGNLFQVEPKMFLKWSQKDLKIYNQYPKLNVNYVVETMKLTNAPMKESLVWRYIDTSPNRKDRFPDGMSRSVDYSKPQWRWPSIWRPAQSVNGITNLEGCHCTRNKLTPGNLLELGPGKDQLKMGCRQILPDPVTKAWVDEQNKINIEKMLGYDRSYDEAKDTMHPGPQFDVEPPVKSQKKDTAVTLKKEKDAPQPSHALQEFVKHIADPLVDKGCNLI